MVEEELEAIENSVPVLHDLLITGVKKSQKMPPAELDLAHKRMSEYLSRRRAGGS